MKTILLISLSLLSGFGAQLNTTFYQTKDKYRLETRRAESGLSDEGFPKGRTSIQLRKANAQPALIFNWYAPEVYLFENESNPIVVACAGSKVYSTNQVYLAFFKGTNIMTSYKASHFLESAIYYSPGVSLTARRIDWYGDSAKMFYVERRDGYVEGFNLIDGRSTSLDLKFRSIGFSPWFAGKMRKYPPEQKLLLVIGSFFAAKEDSNTVYLSEVNELYRQKGLHQYTITNVPLAKLRVESGRVRWFVVSEEGPEEGRFVDGGKLEFDDLDWDGF